MRMFYIRKKFFIVVFAALMLNSLSFAVTSEIIRHSTASDLLKGETDDTIIDSEGTIKLARRATRINCGKNLRDIWVINTIVTDGEGAVYLGTSPNGDIIKYADGKAEKIYPTETDLKKTENNGTFTGG